jgi:methyl-accepting chemotaxis protein
MFSVVKNSITKKLVISFLIIGILPLSILIKMSLNSFDKIAQNNLNKIRTTSESIADLIDRNLFERYGDVQAFALNQAIQDKNTWYDQSEKSPLSKMMNSYVKTYAIYYLSLLVDTEGKLICVNNIDEKGNPINSQSLYSKNYSETSWFKALKNNEFTTSTPFSKPENKNSTGTYIEDLHRDQEVMGTYPDSSGLTIGFSAPVYDAEGKVIAYWSNRAKYIIVEEIVMNTYQKLKEEGLKSTEITLLDGHGNVILDYDPMTKNSEKVSYDFENVIFKLNLVKAGVEAALEAKEGKSGSMYAVHARKQIEQGCGYTHFSGALGYPGMNWSVLVRIPKDESNEITNKLRNSVFLIGLISIILITITALVIARSLVSPIKKVSNTMADIAEGEGDLTARLPVNSLDEIGQLSNNFNKFIEKIHKIIGDTQKNAQSLSEFATNIAATSTQLSSNTNQMGTQTNSVAAAVEELSINMSAVSDQSEAVYTLTEDSKKASELISASMHTVTSSLDSAQQNLDSISNASGQMSSVIDEIAENAEKSRVASIDAVKTIDTASKSISTLVTSTDEIVEIISLINSISDQTKTLALNATIEAARAGEAGKGFSVVANEVKSLARATSDATVNIRSRIDKMKESTEVTVENISQIKVVIESLESMISGIAAAIEEQSIAVKDNSQNTQETSGLLKEIFQKVKVSLTQIHEINGKIDHIKTSAEEVATTTNEAKLATGEVASNIGLVNSGIRDTSQASEELSKNANLLSSMSAELNKLVGKFKV